MKYLSCNITPNYVPITIYANFNLKLFILDFGVLDYESN